MKVGFNMWIRRIFGAKSRHCGKRTIRSTSCRGQDRREGGGVGWSTRAELTLGTHGFVEANTKIEPLIKPDNFASKQCENPTQHCCRGVC